MKTNKTKEVLNHLKSGRSITSLEAIKLYGATRLSAIIFNLKRDGYIITSVTNTSLDRFQNICRFSEYRLDLSQVTNHAPNEPKVKNIFDKPTNIQSLKNSQKSLKKKELSFWGSVWKKLKS